MKDHDPYCEPGLISILFLCQHKHALTRACLEQTAKAVANYEGELEWCFLVNGLEHTESIMNVKMVTEFKAERKTIVLKDKNYGINPGLNDLFQVSRGELCMILECDWYNQDPKVDFLSIVKDIFDDQPELQILQLRDPDDQWENWGRDDPKFNPWTTRPEIIADLGITRAAYMTADRHKYMLARFPGAYTNNPIIIRKELLRRAGHMEEPVVGADPRHGETEFQERIRDMDILSGHINLPLYIHAGGTRRRQVEQLGESNEII
jgi:hypothetical protein